MWHEASVWRRSYFAVRFVDSSSKCDRGFLAFCGPVACWALLLFCPAVAVDVAFVDFIFRPSRHLWGHY